MRSLSPLPRTREHALFLLDVAIVEAGEFADAKPSGVEQFEKSAVAAQQQALVFQLGRSPGEVFCLRREGFLGKFAAVAGCWPHFRKLI